MTSYKLKRHYQRPTKQAAPELDEERLRAMERLALFFERSRFNDYVTLVDHQGRWLRINFLGGIARGIGLAIGFVLLGAVMTLILVKLSGLNIPIISQFLAELLDMVEQYRALRP